MRSRLAAALLYLAIASAGCSSEAAGAKSWKLGTDASAMADLQASAEWAKPRCHWLRTGTGLHFFAQDAEVLKTAGDLGYSNIEQVRMGNRIGWRVELTEAGKVESAKCGSSFLNQNSFGIPVSTRRFISAKQRPEPNQFTPNQAMFDVEFEWVPTTAGDRVKHALTSQRAIAQGLTTARVAMLYNLRGTPKGANGWTVQAIYDTDPPR